MTEYNLIPQVVTIAGSDSGGELACKQILKHFKHGRHLA